jgi:AhpC/TSA family
MKKAFILLTTMALAASAFAAVEVGMPAPDFTGTTIDGKTVHLSDYRGKIVVIESYNPTCPYVHNQYKTGAMQASQKDLTAKGVVWLLVDSVNKNNFGYLAPEQAQKDMVKEKMNITAWIDDSSGTIGHLYDMKTTPDMYVINKDGILVYEGAIDNEPDPSHDPKTANNYVRDAVNDLLSGKTIEVSQTKPYGCGVKYAD